MRKDIQYLRALSILGVIGYHGKQDFFPNGYLGVDLFFAISGFVLAPKFFDVYAKVCLSNKFDSIAAFVSARVRRLYPPLVLSILITFPLTVLTLPTGIFLNKTLNQLYHSLINIGNFSAPNNAGDYFNPYPNPYLHLWSLSVEWQIYLFVLLFFLFLAFLGRLNFSFILLPSSLFLITIISFYWFLQVGHHSIHSYYFSPIRIWEFMFGILIFKANQRYNLFFFQYSKVVATLAIAFFLLLPKIRIDLILPSETLMVSLFLFAIMGKDSNLPFHTIFNWIGDRSYSIYLYHFPLFIVAKHSTLSVFSIWDNRSIPTAIAFLTTLILSNISFNFVEKSRFPRFRFVSLVGILLVCSLLLCVDFANRAKFWGFNSFREQPLFAGDLDKRCDRTSALLRPCLYNTEGKSGHLVLVGDSHATAISEALLEYSKSKDLVLSIFSYKGCKYVEPAVLSNKQRLLYFEDSNICEERDRHFRNYLKLNSPSIIVGTYRSQDCSSNIFLDSCGDMFAQIQIQSFESLAIEFGEARVVLVSPVPEFSDLEFFKPRSLLQHPYKAPSVMSQKDMGVQSFRDEKVLLSNAKRVKILRSIPIFCKFEFCSRRLDFQWLYKDTNHLSVPGSMLILAPLETLLTSLGSLHSNL